MDRWKTSNQLLSQASEYSKREVGLPCSEYVETDPRYLRPSEVDLLLGDATKTKEKLGWSPQTSFEDLVRIMVQSDWEIAKSEAIGARRQAA